MRPQRPAPRHPWADKWRKRDTHYERNTKFCGTGGRRKAFQRRDPLLMKGNKTRFGRKNGHFRQRRGGQEVAENEDDR